MAWLPIPLREFHHDAPTVLDDGIHAWAYDWMPHTPESALVKVSYRHLIVGIVDQFAMLGEAGLRIRYHDGDREYPSSLHMLEDLDHGHLWVFRTQPGSLAEDHPMTSRTPYGMANDIFRAVHDVYGHHITRESFGPRGEKNAWLRHRQNFPQSAHAALWCETRGQNAWTNSHTELPLSERPYAEQKAGYPPIQLI